jgi:hypothetical protein
LADVLAWESAADDICDSSPRLTVEGCDIIPDWEAGQHPIPLPLQQGFSAVFIDFNSAHGAMSEKQSAKDSSPSSCK